MSWYSIGQIVGPALVAATLSQTISAAFIASAIALAISLALALIGVLTGNVDHRREPRWPAGGWRWNILPIMRTYKHVASLQGYCRTSVINCCLIGAHHASLNLRK